MKNEIKKPTIRFSTIGTENIRIKCEIERADGYLAVAYGKTVAEAMMRAAVVFYNRECQEFNTAEYENAEASKHDYSYNAKRYSEKRHPPAIVVDTDLIMDVEMICGQLSPICRQIENAKRDFEERVRPFLRAEMDQVDFMLPKKKGGDR